VLADPGLAEADEVVLFLPPDSASGRTSGFLPTSPAWWHRPSAGHPRPDFAFGCGQSGRGSWPGSVCGFLAVHLVGWLTTDYVRQPSFLRVQHRHPIG
jgi:hypothetical protein